MRVCIVIPLFNEEKIAGETISTVLSYVKNLPAQTMIAAVNDGSTDSTVQILETLAKSFQGQMTLLSHGSNQGYGAALRTGIDFACSSGYDYVLFMDSDLTNHPRYLAGFYEKMAQGVDYIKASRYAPGAGVEGVSWQRRLISMLGNIVARRLYGLPLRDLTNGFRAVKTAVLKKIVSREKGFAVIMEELYLAKPYCRSYAEVAYVLTARSPAQGRTHFTYDLKTYSAYLKYALKSLRVKKPAV